MNTPRLAVLLLAVPLVVAGAGCKRTSAHDQRLGDEATEEAETRAQEGTAISTTTITSADLDGGAGAKDLSGTSFRAEQDDYRVRLRDALDLQESRARARTQDPNSVARRAARRDLLTRDIELLERSTEATWATARATIERDLRATPSPQSQPR